MLTAFRARPIIELKQRDKSKIDALLAYGDRLLVGLNTGALRVYRVNDVTNENAEDASSHQETGTNSTEHDGDPPTAQDSQKPVDLLREVEKFSRRSIEQLAIIKEANLLVCLTDNYVSIYDLQSFTLQEQLSKTKGALVFAVTSNIVKDSATAVPSIVSRLAVAVKRKLVLWSWQDSELLPETHELLLAAPARTLTWSTGTKIICGMNPGYVIADLETEEIADISGPGSIGGGSGSESGRFGGAGTASMSYMGMSNWIPKGLATGLLGGELLLAKDVSTVFIDSVGNPLEKRQIPWVTAPEAIAFSYPYLLALQNPTKGVLEVRNPDTLTLLQSIPLPNASLLQVPQPNISLAHAGKGFLVASDRCVWRMSATDYDDQVDILMDKGQLDEAISLLNLLEDALLANKSERIREAKMRKAQRLFEARKFRDSLDLFTEASAPPERVIRLYPEMISGNLAIAQENVEPDNETGPLLEKLDGEVRQGTKSDSPQPKSSHVKKNSISSINSAGTSPSKRAKNGTPKANRNTKPDSLNEGKVPLGGKELLFAVRELNTFLVDSRTKLQRFINPDGSLKPDAYEDVDDRHGHSNVAFISLLANPAEQSDQNLEDKLRETARLIDTTLFRGYMFAQPSLAGPLFRLANFCDPDVVNEKLLEKNRYHDLVDFFFGKKLHRPALELLQKFGKAEKEDSEAPELHGPERTVAYLQNLPPQHIELILEFSKWPIIENPQLGLEIFLGDTENADTLPRQEVLNFLYPISLKFAVTYLEHIIKDLDDLTPDFHNRLIFLFIERLNVSKGARSSSDLKFERTEDRLQWLERLQRFLHSSKQYSPPKAYSLLPRDDDEFLESRAIVLSKMGQHKQALEIYVFDMKAYDKAEDYCNYVYIEQESQATSPVQSRRPSTITGEEEPESIYHVLLSLYLSPSPPQEPNWLPALDLLSRHGPRLPALETLDLLPPEFPIRDLESYFRGRIRSANSAVTESTIVAGLRKVEVVDAQAFLLLGDKKLKGNAGRSRSVIVEEDRVCGVCHKRLGRSVISVLPDNSVVHYGCSSKTQQTLKGKISAIKGL